jgi:hypothetical protein
MRNCDVTGSDFDEVITEALDKLERYERKEK